MKTLARPALRSAATSISTMAGVRIRALTERHPIKPTSARCHSAWQLNLGRYSTYRRGKSVQTTGTTSDGTIHEHAIDDDDDALAKHVKEPGWDMALVICVLPCRDISAISEIASQKLTIEKPDHLRVVDLGGLRRPPRPPCIA